VLGYLPKDTSYAQRRYFTPGGDWAIANIVLMGEDRTSIHRPDYCLPGQGWQILDKASVKLPIGGAAPYELPTGKWKLNISHKAQDGSEQTFSGVYVFWFVTENQVTDSFPEVMRSMLFHLVRHGELQRWAYISYFTVCLPGQEDAAYARLKDLIIASVPQYQLPPATAK
jgi:hypothetical protein